jgi:dolichol kinase
MQEFSRIFTLTLPILIPGIILIVVLKLKWLCFLDFPLDLGESLGGKRIFGNNKTIRGFVVMMIMAIAVAYFLNLELMNNLSLFIHPIFNKSPVIIGIIYSISYTVGELINSFIKRRLNIFSGQLNKSFIKLQTFFDLSDGIIFVALLLWLIFSISFFEILPAVLIGIFLHLVTDYLMKQLHLKYS